MDERLNLCNLSTFLPLFVDEKAETPRLSTKTALFMDEKGDAIAR